MEEIIKESLLEGWMALLKLASDLPSQTIKKQIFVGLKISLFKKITLLLLER